MYSQSDSNDALPSDEGQPKEARIAEYRTATEAQEPEFAETSQRTRRGRSSSRADDCDTVEELTDKSPESWLINVEISTNKQKAFEQATEVGIDNATIIEIEIERSALERVPIPGKIGEHVGGDNPINDQFAETHVTGNC